MQKMNKFMLFWLKNKQDILVGSFCMLLIFFAAKNLHDNLTIPGRSGLVWAGWMMLIIGASMVLGVAINKISVREQKTINNTSASAEGIKKKAKK